MSLTNLSDVAEPTGEMKRVADELLRKILSGAYPAGLRLPPEVELAGAMGCSRPTLREALRHLSGMGLVASRRGSGVMVLDYRKEGTLALLPVYLEMGRSDVPLGALVRELLNTRAMLAGEAARLAATYATAAALGEAKGLAARLPALSGDPVAHTLCEVDLFRALLVASEVWPTVWFANAFWGPIRGLHATLAPVAWYVPPQHEAMLREMFAAIEAHDAAGASSIVHAHFRAVDERVLPQLDRALRGEA